ncbi:MULTISPECIES: MFS transporter [Cylindrospermopsis]|jgi:predicted MFS family arabinose efflux permease|uniref:MFS transporter n=1 Tax=Cylindrospermopsis curvispora GIHE-G1 TaxID=2666332 RepID=A0A7H0F183_9CYAN|nr:MULTISPECIES: MFS transporter [Cylindrospermopsis]QNP29799.1 MFS transporter [Cylindrospermopsis curvispora GIHE-G1]TPX29763.1 MFS transporter [Cylindrospermopsis raciborskii GIHE 2018]UJL32930.1 MFS transporter [Cylindrospermopsis raciborskii Cr2010]UJS05408.1 MFS transporter [Cylindrospermopsis raciborskii KLL07]
MFPTEPTAINQGFSALVKNRNFMLLWIGQLISQLADKVLLILMIDLLEKKYLPPHLSSGTGRFYLYMAFTLPAIFFGSVGGVIVDRMPKKLIMIGSDVIRGVLTLSIAFLPRQLGILLALNFGISSVTQFFAPAEQATIPLMVKKENLMAANALFSSTMMGALIVGYALGSTILNEAEHIGIDFGKELLVGLLYLLSAAIMLPIQFREQRHTSVVNPVAEFLQGWQYLRTNRLVWNAMIQIVALYCVFASLLELSIRLANRLKLEQTDFSFFVAAAGVGMVLGAAIIGHFSQQLDRQPLPLIGFIFMALALGMFIFTYNLPWGLFLCVFLGLGASLVNVPMQTLIQQYTPPSMHGKVFGFQNHAVNIALSFPLLITTKLVNALGLSLFLFGMSLTVAIIGLWTWQNTRE